MSPLVLRIRACGSRSGTVTWRPPTERYCSGCKYCGSVRAQVDLRSIHSNSHGYMIKYVPSGAYGWLYILAVDGSEYLIRDCLHGRRSITLTPAHLLGAVAESG
jgi:hypothetical protein